MTLTGKTALITGAGRGIGKGCALELARRGARIIANDLAEKDDLTRTVQEIRAAGGQAEALAGNVFDANGCVAVVEEAIQRYGPLQILVSNPAYSVRGRFLEYEADHWEATLRGTLSSGFYVSQRVSRHMVDQGEGGKIVFISSVHAAMPYQDSVAYNAAKAGLNQMARTVAAELAPHRINVNLIEPGWIDTPGERERFDQAHFDKHVPHIPWQRIGRPEDIGKAAAFLASDDADYITGTVLRVDGGWVLKDV